MSRKSLFEGNLDILGVFRREIRKAEQTLEKLDIIYHKELKFLDRLSDRIAQVGGSWTFIISFLVLLFGWVIINALFLTRTPFDPYPFILLNLILSTIAAIQAPIILMSQNRAAKREQARAELDLEKDVRDLHIDQKQLEILLELQKDMVLVKKQLKLK